MSINIHFIAPYYSNYPYGLECRFVPIFQEKGINCTISDIRSQPISNLLQNIRSKKYDLTLCFKGESLTKKLVLSMDSPKVLWFNDDIIVYPQYQELIKKYGIYFDKIYTFNKRQISKYKEIGCKNVDYLPVCTGVDLYSKWDNLEKEYDVTFCANFNNRDRIILNNSLMSFCDIRKYNYWNGQLFGKNAVKLINKSKIVINIAQGSTGVSQRVFETLAMGSFLLTNNIAEDEKLFKDNEHLVYWKNIEDLYNKIDFYLLNEDKREEIAKKGMQEVLNKHLAIHRLDKILNDI